MKAYSLNSPFLFTASLVSFEFLTVLSLTLRFILDSALAVVDGFSKKMDVVEYMVSNAGIKPSSYFSREKLYLVYQLIIFFIKSLFFNTMSAKIFLLMIFFFGFVLWWYFIYKIERINIFFIIFMIWLKVSFVCQQSEDGRNTYSLVGLTAGAYSEAEKKKQKSVQFF